MSELLVHEAVSDRVAAGADVGEQLDQRDAGTADVLVHSLGVEQVPRVEHVQRRPADKELGHYHEQHSDHLQLTRHKALSDILHDPVQGFLIDLR